MFAADLFARGYASAHSPKPAVKATSAKPAKQAGSGDSWVTVGIPRLDSAEKDEDRHDWRVIDTRENKLLVVKKGKPAMWCPIGDVLGE